jgi:hypothetical protein
VLPPAVTHLAGSDTAGPGKRRADQGAVVGIELARVGGLGDESEHDLVAECGAVGTVDRKLRIPSRRDPATGSPLRLGPRRAGSDPAT